MARKEIVRLSVSLLYRNGSVTLQKLQMACVCVYVCVCVWCKAMPYNFALEALFCFFFFCKRCFFFSLFFYFYLFIFFFFLFLKIAKVYAGIVSNGE